MRYKRTKETEPLTWWKIISGIVIFIMGFTLFVAIIGALFSCSKQPENTINDDKCYFACLLSDKYTADSIFVVRDTIWRDDCLTKYWWDKTKAVSDTTQDMFRHCTAFYRNGKLVERERLFYVMDRNKNVPPKIF